MPHVGKVIRLLAALTVLLALGGPGSRAHAATGASSKLDRLLQQRVFTGTGRTRIVVRLAKGADRRATRVILERLGGIPGRLLPIINAYAASLPNSALAALAASPLVEHISVDRLVDGSVDLTGAAVGAAPVRESLGVDGTGVGVAIIDSGITAWHDDLTGANDGQRVDRFVDFVAGRTSSYDDYGHGTHVAGIVAGNGYDSRGGRTGIAPGARLTILKTLDATGAGYVSDVIAALDYILENKEALNIRVANLSLTAPVYESYETDPLTLATRQLVNAGIVVVAAAGNAGRNPQTGETLYGGIGAPANAPWVLTVGASSHQGTVDRTDDSIASFSSRGPGAGGAAAKPDVVAPGVGISSLSDPESALYTRRAAYLLSGAVETAYMPYLSLSGTSMAAPVVSGTIALMLQANPALTPNQVKAILQYTAEVHAGYDAFSQGAGFLNAKGAVELAHHFADPARGATPSDPQWSRGIIWGNRLVKGGRLRADANAWSPSVTWGAATTADGASVAWGVKEPIEGSDVGVLTEEAWVGSATDDNIVWGMLCGGDDCEAVWDNAVVLGTETGDTVVWGMNDAMDTVVWGMSCNLAECDPVIWGSR